VAPRNRVPAGKVARRRDGCVPWTSRSHNALTVAPGSTKAASLRPSGAHARNPLSRLGLSARPGLTGVPVLVTNATRDEFGCPAVEGRASTYAMRSAAGDHTGVVAGPGVGRRRTLPLATSTIQRPAPRPPVWRIPAVGRQETMTVRRARARQPATAVRRRRPASPRWPVRPAGRTRTPPVGRPEKSPVVCRATSHR
jgi:hypothetical protein